MRISIALMTAVAVVTASPAALAMQVHEGEKLPSFSLQTRDGKKVESDGWKGKATVIIFARPGQSRSVAALKDAMLTRGDLDKLPWNLVVVVSGYVSEEAIGGMVKQTGLKATVLLDPEMTVYGKFGVIVTPSTIVVDRQQSIVFAKASHDFSYQRQLAANVRFATGEVDRETRNKLMQTPSQTDDPLKAKLARWVRTAASLAQAGELEHAQTTLQRVLEQAPEYAPAWVEAGYVQLRQRKPDEALASFRKAENLAGVTPQTQLGAGMALIELDKLQEAEKRLTSGLKLSPRPALMHYALGHLYERQGKAAEAMAHYKAAAKTLLDREEGGHYLLSTQPSE